MNIDIPPAVSIGQKAPPDMKTADATAAHPHPAQEKKNTVETPSPGEIETFMTSLVQTAGLFNKRLSYSINDELGLVVVKVIDTETDKVIKELPAQEIQKLMARIREAIGLLIDEKI